MDLFILLEVYWTSWVHNILIKVGTIRGFTSLNILPSYFSVLHLGILWSICCITGMRLYSFLFILFSFSFSNYTVSIDLSSRLLMFSSACSDLLLKTSSEFFISVIALTNFRISICLIFKSSFYLFIESFYFVRLLKTWFP